MDNNEIKKALEICTTTGDCPKCHYNDCTSLCINRIMMDALALITSQEQRIKELTAKITKWEEECDLRGDMWCKLNEENKRLAEENERLRGIGIPDDSTYIKLSDAKHAIMNYIGEQTVSKYASSAECKAARGGAEGAMNELDYIPPANVAPRADTVRKMHTQIKERCIKGGIYPAFVARTIDQIAKEMLEGLK
jgi:hypothetical protein